MTLEEIDTALAEWQSKLDAASGNLLELDDLFVCKRLKGTEEMAPAVLTGTTRDQVVPALAALDHLWQSLSLLTETITRARTLRKSASRLWPSEHLLHEIDALLHGPSIALPASQTALASRTLLTASESVTTTTPDHLLETMLHAFGTAKETILAVDATWNRLEPQLVDANHEAEEISRQAETLHVPLPPDLVAARQKIASLQTRVAADPLGVRTDFAAEIAPPLIRARTWLADLTRQHAQVLADQKRARGLQAELRTANQHCADSYALCQAKIEDPKGARPALSASALADLDTWLTTLEDALALGQWKPARIGLERWLQTAESYLSSLHLALSANQAQQESLAELRGYLASLKVKARAYQARGLRLDPGLDSLAQEAGMLLERTPVPLARATELVSAYEARLAAAQ